MINKFDFSVLCVEPQKDIGEAELQGKPVDVNRNVDDKVSIY